MTEQFQNPYKMLISLYLMEQSALWHVVSEQEKKEIEKQAEQILDNFSEQLSKIKKDINESIPEKGAGHREETRANEKCDEDFRKIMFENAPQKNDDFILAEKGGWK